MKSSEGLVSKNPSYTGPNDEETAHMSNWFHFKSKHTKVQTVKQLAHVDPAIGKFKIYAMLSSATILF